MRTIAPIVAVTALVGLVGVVALPALAQTPPSATATSAAPRKPAPGPILGAGLPVLAVGFGVYWLVRRRSKA
jgi:hypothetical protein